MPLSPIKFLGLTVRGLSAAHAWNSTGSSTLSVDLVADVRDGDAAAAPAVGSPVYFTLGAMSFSGLLQRFDTSLDSQSGRGYSALVTDPREILRNTSVILGSHHSPVSLPNLLNPFGRAEATGFGNSGSSAAGMPWRTVRTQLLAMVNTPAGTAYGDPMRHKGYSYGLDLTDLPDPPPYYRVGPDQTSLADLIDQIALATGRDWFCTLSGLTVVIRTANRTDWPTTAVSAFVAAQQAAGTLINASYGQEDLSGETTSLCLVGPEKLTVYEADDLINFWGYTDGGDPVIGRGGYNFYGPRWKAAAAGLDPLYDRKASLPGPKLATATPPAELAVNTTAFTATQLMEWVAVSSNHEVMDLTATVVADIITAATYECSTLEMRFALAGPTAWLEYIRTARPAVYEKLYGASDAPRLPDAIPHGPDLIADGILTAVGYGLAMAERGADARRERLYEFVQGYARAFYGVQFLAPVGVVARKIDPDTLVVTDSHEPSPVGYLEDGDEPLGLSEINSDLFRDANGLYGPFVRFDAAGAAVTEAGGDGAVFQDAKLYDKAGVAESWVFVGGQPHALVRLSAPLTDEPADAVGGYSVLAALFGLAPQQFDAGADTMADLPRHAPARRTPERVAVPVRSTVETYGPWQATVGDGRAEFRQDASLAPWNYGGHANLNTAAQAIVAASVSAVGRGEAASAEIVGVPLCSLGGAVEAGGPFVTGVSVEYGARGATTRYRWGTVTVKGHQLLPRAFADRVRAAGRSQQELRKTARAAARDALRNRSLIPPKAPRRFGDALPKALARQTPHDVLIAHADLDRDGRVRTHVGTATGPEAVALCRPDDPAAYRGTAVMSLNGMFRPFSMDPLVGTGLLPSYARPSGVTRGLTATSLNPFGSGCDVDLVANGPTYSGLRAFRRGADPSGYRPVALKAPLTLVGWGRTTDQRDAVPADLVHSRPDLHKAGVLDPLWDPWRGVWSVHDGVVGRLESGLSPGGSGTLRVWDGVSATSGTLVVHDWAGVTAAASGSSVVAVYSPHADRWYAVPPSGVSVRDVFAARVGGEAGSQIGWASNPASWRGRGLNGSDAWTDIAPSGVDNAVAVELHGSQFTTRPDAGVLMWPSRQANRYEYLPVQGADRVESPSGVFTFHPGYVTAGLQRWGGVKEVYGDVYVRAQAGIGSGAYVGQAGGLFNFGHGSGTLTLRASDGGNEFEADAARRVTAVGPLKDYTFLGTRRFAPDGTLITNASGVVYDNGNLRYLSVAGPGMFTGVGCYDNWSTLDQAWTKSVGLAAGSCPVGSGIPFGVINGVLSGAESTFSRTGNVYLGTLTSSSASSWLMVQEFYAVGSDTAPSSQMRGQDLGPVSSPGWGHQVFKGGIYVSEFRNDDPWFNIDASYIRTGVLGSGRGGTGGTGGALAPANNLSDLTNVTTAQANLGLGSAATADAADFIPAPGTPPMYPGTMMVWDGAAWQSFPGPTSDGTYTPQFVVSGGVLTGINWV